MVLMGGSDFDFSLSVPASIKNPVAASSGPALAQWHANVFQFSFFLWMLTPVDVDGDGRFTLTDAFKFAGANAATGHHAGRPVSFVLATELYGKIAAAQKQAALGMTPALQLQFDTLGRQVQDQLMILHTASRPWILHANQARHIEFG